MPAYKDNKTGTWFVKFYCKDWTGENKQIKKRGFATKREALDYERNYKIRQEKNLDMTFGEFWKLYTEDVKPRVKLNTWLTKENIVEKKILPYFRNLKMNEITLADVRKWQNEMLALKDTEGKPYSQTYRKTMHNMLSTIFNHTCRFYNLKSNPARQTLTLKRIQSVLTNHIRDCRDRTILQVLRHRRVTEPSSCRSFLQRRCRNILQCFMTRLRRTGYFR